MYKTIIECFIDHFVTNFSHKINVDNHTINNDFSDHNSILTEINFVSQSEDYQISSCIDYKRFRDSLQLYLLEDYDELDVNNYCDFIIQALNNSENDATEKGNVRKRRKDLLCPWYNLKIESENVYTNITQGDYKLLFK